MEIVKWNVLDELYANHNVRSSIRATDQKTILAITFMYSRLESVCFNLFVLGVTSFLHVWPTCRPLVQSWPQWATRPRRPNQVWCHQPSGSTWRSPLAYKGSSAGCTGSNSWPSKSWPPLINSEMAPIEDIPHLQLFFVLLCHSEL